MKLKTLLVFQLLYVIFCLIWNVISFLNLTSGRPALAPGNPLIDGSLASVYGLVLILGFVKKIKIFRILMGISALSIGYIVCLAIINDVSLYSSRFAWYVAIGINVFGLIFTVIAALGKFKDNEKLIN